jgi:hypothetical protein
VLVNGDPVALQRDQARAATEAAAATLTLGAVGRDPGRRHTPGVAVPEGVVSAITSARADTALNCRWEPPEPARQAPTATGLTPRAQTVLDQVRATFGDLPVGGFDPAGVDDGHGARSTHYEGRAVDVFFRPVTEEGTTAGWVLSQWLVAHADDLTVQFVIFDDHVWGVRQSSRGWQDYLVPEPADEILRHLDHVHVDVLRGG